MPAAAPATLSEAPPATLPEAVPANPQPAAVAKPPLAAVGKPPTPAVAKPPAPAVETTPTPDDSPSARALLDTLFAKSAQAPDDRLYEFIGTIPRSLALAAVQEASKLDLTKARNPSAYLMGVLKRRVAESVPSATSSAAPSVGAGVGATDKGYQGGRARGGKKLKVRQREWT